MAAYLTVADYLTRVGRQQLPKIEPSGGGAPVTDTARIQEALDDASDVLRGALPRDLFTLAGVAIPFATLKPWLQAAVVPCTRLFAQYLLSDASVGENDLLQMRRDAAQQALDKVCHNADILRVLPTFDDDEEPETPAVGIGPYYLLLSEDTTFTQLEVVASGASRPVAIPTGAIPDGEPRYVAYAVPATEGEPDYLYHYRAGARSTQNFINAFEAAPNLDIIGVRHRLVRSRVQWASSANGLVLEAGRLADVPETTVDPALPTVAGLRYLLAREDDDQFVAADVITTGSEDQAQAVPDGEDAIVPDGETRWFAYARPAGRGAYTFSYLYPCAFPNTLNQFNAFTDNGSELVINGEDCRILLARSAYTTVANGTCWEAD